MKRLLILTTVILILTSCGANRGRIGGAFGGAGGPSPTDVTSNGVYVKTRAIDAIESLRAPINGQKDPNCSLFQDVTNPTIFALRGLAYDETLFFREVKGLRGTVLNSQNSVARLNPNSDFIFIDSFYQTNENPSRESLIATLTEQRLIVSLKRLQNSGRPENQFGSTIYENISIVSFRILNSALTEFCR